VQGRVARPTQQAVRDKLIAFMAATSQAQAEATKAAQPAGIEHAKQSGDRAYLGRKPSYTRDQFNKVCAVLLRSRRKLASPDRPSIGSRVTLRVLRVLWLLGGCDPPR
jgi:DNA invertase Pin-like site-specific DNA recombinase